VRYAVAQGIATTQRSLEGTVSTGLTTPWYSSSMETCYNAVESVTYNVEYDATYGNITAINASVVVAEIPGSGIMSIKQSFAVNWFESNATYVYQAARSGAPGYLAGYPLLAGYLGSSEVGGSSRSGIYQAVDGAEVIAPGTDGACSSDDKTPIRFKSNMKSQCSVNLTSSDLQTYCLAGNIPSFLQFNWTYIGMFGNADQVYTGNWTPIVYGATTPTATWDDSTLKCSSIVSGLRIEVLYGRYGQVQRGQDGIAAFYVYYDTEDWEYTSSSSDGQTFTHSVTVTFHDMHNEVEERKPMLPPIIEAVPDDLFHPFYPFGMAAAPRQSALGYIGVIGAALCMLWVTLCA